MITPLAVSRGARNRKRCRDSLLRLHLFLDDAELQTEPFRRLVVNRMAELAAVEALRPLLFGVHLQRQEVNDEQALFLVERLDLDLAIKLLEHRVHLGGVLARRVIRHADADRGLALLVARGGVVDRLGDLVVAGDMRIERDVGEAALGRQALDLGEARHLLQGGGNLLHALGALDIANVERHRHGMRFDFLTGSGARQCQDERGQQQDAHDRPPGMSAAALPRSRPDRS
jgi:hypothetical protein